MLNEQCQLVLKEGYRRYVATKDRTHIDDAISLVKTLSPNKFFQGEKDLNLEKRVFFHEPRSGHWSGTYIKPYGAK
jgi:hypothetical protein